MSDDSIQSGEKENNTAIVSGDMLNNEVHFASAFVTPFAAAVAAELEDFGLSKQKIDEIMLRSARRFGASNGDVLRGLALKDQDQEGKSAAY